MDLKRLFILLLVCFLRYAQNDLVYEACKDNVPKVACFDCTDPVMSQFCQFTCNKCVDRNGTSSSVSVPFGQPQSGIKYLIKYSDSNNQDCFFGIINDTILCNLNPMEFFLVDVPSTISQPQTEFQLPYSTVDSFYTKTTFNTWNTDDMVFGQIDGYPQTVIVTYKIKSSLNITSLNFVISNFHLCVGSYGLTNLRVYLRVSEDSLFNNVFIDIQNMLYKHSKSYLLNEPYMKFLVTLEQSNIDLLNLYNDASKIYKGLVNYIGIIVIPESGLINNSYCKVYRRNIKLNVTYEKDCTFKVNDGVGGGEIHIGNVKNEAECIAICYKKQNENPNINGVTTNIAGNDCFCEYGMQSQTGDSVWKSCFILLIDSRIQSLTSESGISFNTDITLISHPNISFGQSVQNYPSTSLFLYNVQILSYVDVSSLIFSISSNCNNLNNLKMRAYLLVSQDNSFNNIFVDLKNKLYNYSWLLLSNKPFVKLVLHQGYASIDLVNLFNNAKNNYPYFVNYIGVIVIFDDILQNNVYCQVNQNQNEFLVIKGKVWKGAVSFQSATGDKYLRHQYKFIKLDSSDPGDRSFYIHQKDSYISIQVANPNFLPYYIGKHDDHFEITSDTNVAAFTLVVKGLIIQNIVSINSSSVNVTINATFPLSSLSTYLVIKCKHPNDVVKLYPVTNYTAVISSLQSYTLYKFSAGVRNEFGFFAYETGIFSYRTDKDVPAGYPRNFTVKTLNFTTLFLSWATVESSMRKGIILNYIYSCNNTEESISNPVDNSTFNATVYNLNPDGIYNCSLAACNNVGCGIQAFVFNYALVGIPAGYPKNFTIKKVNFTTLSLSWAEIESSMRKGIISNYIYSCYNSEESFSNSVDNSTFNVAVYNLNPDSIYNCSLAACNKVGCGVQAFVFNNTLVGIPTGFPLNFTVKKVNFTTLLLSWDNVEYSMRNGIIIKYFYSCNNTLISFSNVVNNTYNVTVSDIDPDNLYTCSVAGCTKVGCGVNVTTLVETAWSQWGSWTSCNSSFGFINRTRECHLFYSTKWCSGNNLEVDQCSEKWAMWSECSVTCGVGNRTRHSLQGKPIIKVESCKPIDCPVDGIWGNWVSSNCSTTCGNGIIFHKRICKEPLYNGRDCIGVANYTDVCDTDIICPVNGNFSKWSLWSLCNQPCGGGMKSRFRSCSNLYPMFGGQGCYGNLTEFESCNQQSCQSVDVNLKVNFVDKRFYNRVALKELLKAAISNIYSSYKVNGGFRVVIHSIDLSP